MIVTTVIDPCVLRLFSNQLAGLRRVSKHDKCGHFCAPRDAGRNVVLSGMNFIGPVRPLSTGEETRSGPA